MAYSHLLVYIYFVFLSIISNFVRLFSPFNTSGLRHYLARLHRKTLCYSKSTEMLGYSIRLLIHYLKFQEVPIPY